MEHPCKECLVKSCCSERCKDFAIYLYKTKDYKQAGHLVEIHIENLTYEQAIKHILIVENTYRYIKMMEKN